MVKILLDAEIEVLVNREWNVLGAGALGDDPFIPAVSVFAYRVSPPPEEIFEDSIAWKEGLDPDDFAHGIIRVSTYPNSKGGSHEEYWVSLGSKEDIIKEAESRFNLATRAYRRKMRRESKH